MALSMDEMLRALHKADPSTLNKRYATLADVTKAYNTIVAKKPAAPAAPVPAAPQAPAIPPPPPTQQPPVVVAPPPPTTPNGDPGPVPPVSLPPGQTEPAPFDPGTAVNTAPVTGTAGSVVDATKSGMNDPSKEIKDTATAVQAEQAAAENEAKRNLQLNNPNQIGPTGSQQVTMDANGNVIVTDKLSENQQQILNQGEGLTQTGQQLALERLKGGAFNSDFNPNTAARTTTGDLEKDRARIEDALFARMTRNLDRDQATASKQMEQTLQNRGIPFSTDPNSQYQQALRRTNERFDTQRENARQDAVAAGGNEYQRDFGINEQLIANQMSQAQTARNQNLSEMTSLQGMGVGLQMPNFTPYQGAKYDPANPLDAFVSLSQLSDADKERALQKAIAEMQNKRSGSGIRATHTTPNDGAFSTGAPPGL